LIVAAASVALFVLVGLIVRHAHRLPDEKGLDAHPADLGAPLPLDVTHPGEPMTERELDAERVHSQDGVSQVP
jgi:hypothetical protein